jgi:hypothetical protein
MDELDHKIQGSNDGTTWVDLLDLPFVDWRYPDPNPDNLINLSNVVDTTSNVTYRYVRLYSDPTVYCCYDHIQYYGLV